MLPACQHLGSSDPMPWKLIVTCKRANSWAERLCGGRDLLLHHRPHSIQAAPAAVKSSPSIIFLPPLRWASAGPQAHSSSHHGGPSNTQRPHSCSYEHFHIILQNKRQNIPHFSYPELSCSLGK